MNNLIRTANRLPFDFQDGLKVMGKDISVLIEELINTSNSRVVLNNANILAGLGFSPVNRAGDTMTGNLNVNGNIIASGDVTAYSDEKLKTDWLDLGTNFVSKLSKVQSGTYTRVDTLKRQVGVSAQSLHEVLPEAVVVTDDGTLSVAYGNAALASVIELAREVVELKHALVDSNKEIEKLRGVVRDVEMLTDLVQKMDTHIRAMSK